MMSREKSAVKSVLPWASTCISKGCGRWWVVSGEWWWVAPWVLPGRWVVLGWVVLGVLWVGGWC